MTVLNNTRALTLTLSVLDVHLDFTLEVVVVFEAMLELEVDQGTKVVVERKEALLALLVGLEFSLEGNRVAAAPDVRGSAVHAVTVRPRHKRLDADAETLVYNGLGEVLTATVGALELVLFNVD